MKMGQQIYSQEQADGAAAAGATDADADSASARGGGPTCVDAEFLRGGRREEGLSGGSRN